METPEKLPPIVMANPEIYNRQQHGLPINAESTEPVVLSVVGVAFNEALFAEGGYVGSIIRHSAGRG